MTGLTSQKRRRMPGTQNVRGSCQRTGNLFLNGLSVATGLLSRSALQPFVRQTKSFVGQIREATLEDQ